MSARTLLRAALLKKSAGGACEGTCAGAPTTNAPGTSDAPGDLETFAAGEFHPKVKVAPGNEKTAGVLDWLLKTAGIAKVAAKRPGRLDGDESLDKLAKLHSKRKQK